MGIPSYFSNIIKKSPEVLDKLNRAKHPCDELYLDSNSIIYDCLRSENKDIFKLVCDKISLYIETVKPKRFTYVAFDGVAPMAKISQQRERRYKSKLEERMLGKKGFDTSVITPGTPFMKKLNLKIRDYFKLKKNVILDLCDNVGEGEHKLFHYIRNKKYNKERIMIYGMDADLIVLSINHLPRNIVLLREIPDYFNKYVCNWSKDAIYVMNIREFNLNIEKTMISMNLGEKKNHDYILLTFLLGNDFMPHFPSLNIRTFGMDVLLNTYRKVFGSNDKKITNGRVVYWCNFKKLIENLTIDEDYRILDEMDIREKQSKIPEETREDKYQNIPVKNRCKEFYINPEKSGWRERYYETLFGFHPSEYFLKKLCVNYLEGLEWCINYYSSGCIDWKWKYNYSYPPLLQDLVKYIPHFQTNMLSKKKKDPISKELQLAYVLPVEKKELIDSVLFSKLFERGYYDNPDIEWSYCRYFWESHIKFANVNIDV